MFVAMLNVGLLFDLAKMQFKYKTISKHYLSLVNSASGADQFLPDRRGADFFRGGTGALPRS